MQNRKNQLIKNMKELLNSYNNGMMNIGDFQAKAIQLLEKSFFDELWEMLPSDAQKNIIGIMMMPEVETDGTIEGISYYRPRTDSEHELRRWLLKSGRISN